MARPLGAEALRVSGTVRRQAVLALPGTEPGCIEPGLGPGPGPGRPMILTRTRTAELDRDDGHYAAPRRLTTSQTDGDRAGPNSAAELQPGPAVAIFKFTSYGTGTRRCQ